MVIHTTGSSKFLKGGVPFALSLGLLVFALAPLATDAAVSPPISIDTVSDASNHSYDTPTTFSCDENPLTGEVTISGSGAGTSGEAGDIGNYHVSIDWGDSNIDSGLGSFAPAAGQGNFTFTFTDAHTYASTGSYDVTAALYHHTDDGDLNQATDSVSLVTCAPPVPTGTIEITKYECPADTIVTRDDNGVDGTVPGGCVAEEGATFGYVQGDQTNADSPYPEVGHTPTEGGATNASGVLDITLPATGRYLVEETDGNQTKLADNAILGLYCTGDGDTSGNNDNQELTFVPADGTTHCVAYDPAPPAPPEVPSCSIVSDASTQTSGHDSVVLTFIHSAWTNLLYAATGAEWIWGEQGVTDPTVDTTEVFTKVVHIAGTPTSASIVLAADNGYQVRVNGTLIADQLTVEHNYEATTTIAIPIADLLPDADNTFEITVKNFALSGSTAETNPAGLDYNIIINDATCSAPQPPPPPTCDADQELLANPSFENPTVTNAANWNVFPSGTTGLAWLVSWLGAPASGRPDIANLELQKGVNGWTASDGSQWAELDTDWNGPSGPNGSPSSVSIGQDITTIPGDTYTFSFDFSPRPGTNAAENKVEALAGGVVIGTAGPTDGSALSNTSWTNESFTFVATSTTTHVALRDVGTPSDSLGSFVDNTSLRCSVPEPTNDATVVATKVVCDNEADLPNWGAGGHGPITATTAADFVAQSDGKCHLQSGWSFEWGDQNAGDGGDATVGHVNGYTTFGPTDDNGVATTTVPLDNLSEIHLREVLQDGYIPFTYDSASTTPNGNDVSAEFYCSNDVLNYDNWDFIRSPEANIDYYCVGFNAPVAPQTSTVTMCKTDDSDHPLAGWNLTLAGAHVEDLTVPTNLSSGIDTLTSLLAGTSYLSIATGTWNNQGGANPVDAEYSTTDNWATHMDGYTGYSTDILELQANQTFDPNSNWGPYNSAHDYGLSFTQATSGPANFRIFDGTGTTQNESWFGDNSGTLGVSLNKGYAGITDETGCVTFDNVPYGDYTAGETPQDGWSEVSGAGPVSINEPEQSIVIVNTQGNGGGSGGSLKVHILKYLDNGDDGIAQIPDDSSAPSFPMASSWNASNLGSGSGTYVLGNNEGGASFRYAADTSSMDAPADYATNEVTGGDSPVVASVEACSPGKYLLEGYKTGDTLDEAENADLSATSPSFTGLTADKYVIVVNEACPTEPQGPTETSQTIVVHQEDLASNPSDALLGKWFFWDDGSNNILNSLGSFVDGPSGQPLGDGSAQISVTAGERTALVTGALAGTSLADITSLGYSTYRSEGTSALALALQFDINTNGTSSPASYQGRLVYEPYFAHTVSDNTWQMWNPMDGSIGWWFSKGDISNPNGCSEATPCTWNQILAAYPNIGISGGTFLKAGQWSDDFTGNVDAFSIGITDGTNATTTTYDFDPTPTPPQNPPGGGGGGGGLSCAMSIAPSSIGSGGFAKLTWSSVGITNVDISGVATATTSSGSTWVSPSSTQTYTGTFHAGNGQTVICSSTLTVTGGGGPIVPDGLVLGASTSTGPTCGPLLTQYLRQGNPNNLPDQVTKLQQFLKDNNFATFSATGFFGPLTTSAVKAFQQQYASQVLTPWGINSPTGLVYLTTRRLINLLYCPTLDIPVPTPLTDWNDVQG